MSEEQSQAALAKLGLTNIQARVYISVAKLGDASIKTISNIAKIDRANLYRTMSELQEIGLVQLFIGRPNTYRALPIQEAFQFMLQRKKKEFEEIQKNTLQTAKRLEANGLKEVMLNECSFQITPAKEGQLIVTKRTFLNAKKSHDGILNCAHFININSKEEKKGDVFKKSLSKGVNFRYIFYCEKNESKTTISKLIKIVKEYDGLKGKFEVRFIHQPPEAIFAILDKKEVLMHTQPVPNWVGTPCLHSTNVCLVGVIQKYFEELWSKAEEPCPSS